MEVDANHNWKQMNLLHLVYPRDDAIAKVLAYCSTAPLIIIISVATLLFIRRDLHTICLFGGVLFDEAINAALKRILKHPRPDTPYENKLRTYGMPSNHSQFMGFFCTYSVLFVWIRLHPNSIQRRWRYFLCAASITLCGVTCYSRSFGQLLMLQDFTHIPNVLSYEYTNWRDWRRRNSRLE
ncbi:Dolichyldiphosphatase 1 [Clonorchis sinensis]|uniref:Dolichyldiphosphatase n=1 Tax=Clonorchis sinensis TaxID=79923 RepID=A0A8T1MN34_CLOSI|nr:Dolichyldiphosphatase 1 [Clonorchis sinensis]